MCKNFDINFIRYCKTIECLLILYIRAPVIQGCTENAFAGDKGNALRSRQTETTDGHECSPGPVHPSGVITSSSVQAHYSQI